MNTPRQYDIKDAARHLDVAASTLRYWEREGLVQADRNHHNDYRRYALHDLIDASEIAFYRKLGVPVKDLKNYRTMSINTLDDALERTEQDAARRMDELEAMRIRLARQRELNKLAMELRCVGMQAGKPQIEKLSAIDYDNEAMWRILADKPWRYGIVVRASNPAIAQEAIVDEAQGNTELLWERHQCNNLQNAQECLLCVKPNGNLTNARELFTQAIKQGANPSHLIGKYLLTASEGTGTNRWDYYQAWVI